MKNKRTGFFFSLSTESVKYLSPTFFLGTSDGQLLAIQWHLNKDTLNNVLWLKYSQKGFLKLQQESTIE